MLMLQSYDDVHSRLCEKGLNDSQLLENIAQSYSESAWLNALLTRYPIQELEEPLNRQLKNRQKQERVRWKALHSIHAVAAASSHDRGYEFLKQWAQQQNDAETKPSYRETSDRQTSQERLVKTAALTQRYQKSLMEISERFLEYARTGYWKSDSAQEDRRKCFSEYYVSEQSNAQYMATIVWLYDWLKENAPDPSDYLWEEFYDVLEDARQAHAGVVTRSSRWGARPWSCIRGFAERLQDYAALRKNEQDDAQRLEQWLIKKTPETRVPQELTVETLLSQDSSFPPQAATAWGARHQHPYSWQCLAILERQGLIALPQWEEKIRLAAERALKGEKKRISEGKFLWLWEHALRVQILDEKRLEECENHSLEETLRDYISESLGALVSSNGQPTAWLYSLFIASIAHDHARDGYTLAHQSEPKYRYVTAPEVDIAQHRYQYVEARLCYFQEILQSRQQLTDDNLYETFTNMPEQQIHALWDKGAGFGFWGRMPSNQASHLVMKRRQILNFLRNLCSSQPLTEERWQNVFFARYDDELSGIEQREYTREEKPSFPAGFSADLFHLQPTKTQSSFWAWEHSGRQASSVMTQYLEEKVELSTWLELTENMAEVSQLSQQLFLDIGAIAEAQKWDLHQQLLEKWRLGLAPRFCGQELEKVNEKQRHKLEEYASIWYKNHHNPDGFFYTLSHKMKVLFVHQWCADLNTNSPPIRWPEKIYTQLCAPEVFGEVVTHRSEALGKVLSFLLKNYMLQAAYDVLKRAPHYALDISQKTKGELFGFVSQNAQESLKLEFAQLLFETQWLDDALADKLLIALLEEMGPQHTEKLFGYRFSAQPSAQQLLTLLRSCQLNAHKSVIAIFEKLCHFDNTDKWHDSPPQYPECYSWAQIMGALPERIFSCKRDQGALYFEQYFKYFFDYKNVSQEIRTTWLVALHQEVAHMPLLRTRYRNLLQRVIAPNKQLFESTAFDDRLFLVNHNYEMLGVLFDSKLLNLWEWDQENDNILKRIIKAGPPQRELSPVDIQALKKIAAMIRYNTTIEIHESAELFENILHDVYAPVLCAFLRALNIPVTSIWEKLKSHPGLKPQLKEYLRESYLDSLPGYRREFSCPEMDHFVLSKLESAEQASQSWQTIQNKRWGFFIDPHTQRTPPEALCAPPMNHEKHQEINRWIHSGFPIERPGHPSLITLLENTPYPLSAGVKRKCEQQRAERYQWRRNSQILRFTPHQGSRNLEQDLYFGQSSIPALLPSQARTEPENPRSKNRSQYQRK